MPSTDTSETPRAQRLRLFGAGLFGLGAVAAVVLMLTVDSSGWTTAAGCAPETVHEPRPYRFSLLPYPMVTFTDGCNEITYEHPAWFASYLSLSGLVFVLVGVVDEYRGDDKSALASR